ncbi:MAG: histidine--tRNA ligase [Parachlamydiales bacterium]|jgi:histidyl-tRNA synthetase
MTFNAPPGVFDIIPDSPNDLWRSSFLWTHVENIARHCAELFGFSELRTPLFERQELFQRGVGDATDIVSKEMYTFVDRGNRAMALRPEGTAPAIRAYIENRLDQQPGQQKLFYLAPMFRYERAQAGRYRQHHQFGVEAFGSDAPAQDVEVIDLLFNFYENLGIKNLTLNINTLGDNEGRLVFREKLVSYLEKYSADLSNDSQNRLKINPLRILDSKDPKDQEILQNAPSLFSCLSDASKSNFEQVCNLLKGINIDYTISPKLVRGLDYYNGVVFEVTSNVLGSQNSIGGGGRYDGLVKKLGGPNTPSCGFGTGLERIIQTLIAQDSTPPRLPGPRLYLIALGETAYNFCFKLMHELRAQNIPVQMDLSNRKLAKSMQFANSVRAEFTAVVGDNELAENILQLKNMSTGESKRVSLEKIPEILKFA